MEMEMDLKLISSYGRIAFLVLLAMLSAEGSWAQSTSCLNQLAPCFRYLNGSRDVPDSCCNPLKSVIKSDPECLCSLMSNQGSRKADQAGIDVAKAQELPGKCGQRINPLGCLKGSTGSKNSDQDSSASALLFKSHSSLRVALVLSMMTVQILLVSKII